MGACERVMSKMLDQVEKQEKHERRHQQRSQTQEQREQRRQQATQQRQVRARSGQLTYLLHRSKESLKADMVRKRSLVEKASIMQTQVRQPHNQSRCAVKLPSGATSKI